MNIFESSGSIVRTSAEIGRELAAGALGKVLRLPPNKEFVDELENTHLDHEVVVATKTYELGRQRHVPELGFIGGGWLLRLMCQADDDPEIPEQKVKEIAQFALEEGLDPILEPVLSDEEATHAAGLLQKHDPVTEVFFERKK